VSDNPDFDILWKAVMGNGKKGLMQSVDEIRKDLYANPDTGEPGLVADMRAVKGFMADLTSQGRTLVTIGKVIAWAISAGVIGFTVKFLLGL